MLNSDGSSGERSLTLRGDGQESSVTNTSVSTRIRQIITRNLEEQPAGREESLNSNAQTKALNTCSTNNKCVSLDISYHYTLCVCMICFLIPAESSEVSELEESRALREQLSPSQMDRDQPLVRQASLTDRVGVTQGSNTFSGQGQAVEHYLHF